MTLLRIRGRAPGATGTALVAETWWQSIGWGDGMFVRWAKFATEAEALETIGLEPG